MIHPRRSLLFMPGSNARALEKARILPADGIILDLEDSVAPDAKALAREQIAQAIAAKGFGKREVWVRTNGLDTPWWIDDVTMAGKAGPTASWCQRSPASRISTPSATGWPASPPTARSRSGR